MGIGGCFTGDGNTLTMLITLIIIILIINCFCEAKA
ncbi:hypothetical protein SAMN00017405_2295 [Desulfonispora thiosulfatigenes DSM 11270]|uniref:Uncharacterized protein n=1 Tax=Desulfonispora thiosulfatigenes DSM 11270 TaxID=656914 RepID=A0A1W1VDY6_DESTI|nr:hypothetical protein SAMN00017405_2295 [Desulfonispora thiosulfatigenes DSM 11270]